jgi:hypothetical protein
MMNTLIDSMLLAVVLVAPVLPVLYAMMLSVADALITVFKNWEDTDSGD